MVPLFQLPLIVKSNCLLKPLLGGGIKFPRIFYPPPPKFCQEVGVVPLFQLPLVVKSNCLLSPLLGGGGGGG